MKPYEEFLPNGGPPSLAKVWKRNAIIIAVASLIPLFTHGSLSVHILVEALILLVCFILFISAPEAVSIIISGIDSTFTYRTMNCFGRMKDTKVYLPDAKITYKYTTIHRYTRGWQLSLYNNYFRNRIVIKEESANGYSPELMDKMVDMINEVKGTPDNGQ